MNRCWCFRVDTSKLHFFFSEIQEGKLRQGWGWDEKQDLRNFKMDDGAGRNRPMFDKVKKGDIIIIPQLPYWGEVSLLEATEDWNIGYRFEINNKFNDYGHIFPVKYIKKFSRHNEKVTGNIRSTLKNPSRFWNIDHYQADVKLLLTTEQDVLFIQQDYQSRLENSIGSVFEDVFNIDAFSDKLYNKLIEQFTRDEWEHALVYGLKKLFPFYQIERVGGIKEAQHGTDILIKMPSLVANFQYAIAIQVKDYKGYVGNEVIAQINKADDYWKQENIKLIDKIIIITKAEKNQNLQLANFDDSVRIIFAHDLKQLLTEIGKNFIGIK
jgi:hypothetical protein